MKYTTYYTSVERVEYEFDENDLKKILIKHLTGKEYVEGMWDVDYVDIYNKNSDDYPSGWYIRLTHKMEKDTKKEDSKEAK